MGLLRWLFARPKKFKIECYRIETQIKLSKPIPTPLGGKVTLLNACVDAVVVVRGSKATIKKIALSRGQKFNVSTPIRGEAWHATGLPDKGLRLALGMDLENPNSGISKQVFPRKKKPDVPASRKQKHLAKKLRIKYPPEITMREMSELITARLEKIRR